MKYFIGWDPSGWSNNGDAICIFPEVLNEVDLPNLASFYPASKKPNQELNSGKTVISQWLESMDSQISFPNFLKPLKLDEKEVEHITLAIDCPLGTPKEFRSLICKPGGKTLPYSRQDDSSINKYLYRSTERFIFEKTKELPLSGIASFLGHVVTKVRHILSGLKLEIQRPGVFQSFDSRLTVIECYPRLLKKGAEKPAAKNAVGHLDGFKFFSHASVCSMIKEYDSQCTTESEKIYRPSSPNRYAWQNNHLLDAILCAYVARWFAKSEPHVPAEHQKDAISEGWIWTPGDEA